MISTSLYVCILYENSKIFLGGENHSSVEEIREFLLSIGVKGIKKRRNKSILQLDS